MKGKLKPIKEILSEIQPTDNKPELVKKYLAKKATNDSSLDEIVELPQVRGKVYNNGVCVSDKGENFGIALIHISVDEYTQRNAFGFSTGVKGISEKIDYQILDLKNKKQLFEFGPVTYRDGDGNAGDHWELNYRDAKILEENGDKVVYGLHSDREIVIYEFNKKTNKNKLLETFDLGRERKNAEKMEKLEQAFKEMNLDAIRDFMSERDHFTKVHKLNDDYALVIKHDPYGDTGRRHADVYLIARDKGLIELGTHMKKFMGGQTTQSFGIEEESIRLEGDELVIDYVIKETESVFNGGGGFNHNELGKTAYTERVNAKDMPLKAIKLDDLIQKQKQNWLSPGNIHPIPITDEGEATYPYAIEKTTVNEKTLVTVVKVIDCERFTRGTIYDPQIKTTVYKIENIETKPVITEILSETSERGDAQGGLTLRAYQNKNKLEFASKPEAKAIYNGISNTFDVTYKLRDNEGKEVEKRHFINMWQI